MYFDEGEEGEEVRLHPVVLPLSLSSSEGLDLSTMVLTAMTPLYHSMIDGGYTLEPPNKGHFGTSHFVLCREAVLFR